MELNSDFNRFAKNQWFNLFFNPYSLALLFGTIIILLLPGIFQKYQIKILKKERVADKHYIYFADLDGNGRKEKIEIISPWNGQTAVIVYDRERVKYQVNFQGEWLGTTGPFWGDVNQDGKLELFVFTLYDNQILLNCFEAITTLPYCSNLPINSYHKFNETIDLGIYPCTLWDVNEDGIKEFYFSLITGFSTFPRRMIGVDLAKDTVFASPQTCVNLLFPQAIDLDNDGQPEFVGNTQAVGNCDSTKEYSDHFTWLMVLDSHLSFRFLPKKIGRFASKLYVVPINNGDNNFLVALNVNLGKNQDFSSINVFNDKGKLVRKKLFKHENLSEAFLLKNDRHPDRFYLIQSNGQIEEWDFNLNRIGLQKTEPFSDPMPFIVTLRNKQKLYFFKLKDLDNMLILDEKLKDSVILKNVGAQEINFITSIGNRGHEMEFFLAGQKYNYYFLYLQNPFYYLKYPIYLAIYLLSGLLFFLMQKGLKARTEQKYQAQKQLAELQLRAIKNQLNPHFTFNILNSIGSLFQSKDSEQADYVFGKYSKLLRQTILDSDKFEVELGEELDFVKNYLDLERFRLNNAFEYDIKIDDDQTRQFKIPKMLIHTFAENAVKHGLRHLEKPGKLEIEVRKEGEYCLIKIEDNGIGREQAKKKNTLGTGTGYKVLEQIIDLYQYLKNRKITYFVRDKYDAFNQPLGTEVIIKIPIQG